MRTCYCSNGHLPRGRCLLLAFAAVCVLAGSLADAIDRESLAGGHVMEPSEMQNVVKEYPEWIEGQGPLERVPPENAQHWVSAFPILGSIFEKPPFKVIVALEVMTKVIQNGNPLTDKEKEGFERWMTRLSQVKDSAAPASELQKAIDVAKKNSEEANALYSLTRPVSEIVGVPPPFLVLDVFHNNQMNAEDIEKMDTNCNKKRTIYGVEKFKREMQYVVLYSTDDTQPKELQWISVPQDKIDNDGKYVERTKTWADYNPFTHVSNGQVQSRPENYHLQFLLSCFPKISYE